MSERKQKVIPCRWTENKRHRNQQWKVWRKKSGGWEFWKQSGEYGRVCKVEVEDSHRDRCWRGALLNIIILGVTLGCHVENKCSYHWWSVLVCLEPVTMETNDYFVNTHVRNEVHWYEHHWPLLLSLRCTELVVTMLQLYMKVLLCCSAL